MDKKDETILRALMENSRVPVTHIASELGITETAVRKRIAKLESRGAIRGYTAIVDPFYMGYESVALVGIDARPEKILSVLEAVKGMEGVRNASLTTGDHMIMFEVWCRGEKELQRTLREVEKKKGVTRVCPAIRIKSG